MTKGGVLVRLVGPSCYRLCAIQKCIIQYCIIYWGGIMDNPFEYGRELGPGELADRETEVAEVRRALTSGAKHFLIGPRRYGKSSVHNVATHEARQAGATVLRYNVEAYPDLEGLLETIIADAAKASRGPAERVADRIATVFRSLRPKVSYSPLDQSWSVGLDRQATDAPTPRLVETLHGVEELAAQADHPMGLVLDEIQHLLANGLDAERQLRAAVQEHRHLGYVFAGSDTSLLSAMTTNPARPFYRLGSVRMLDEVPRPAFREHLAAGFALLGGSAPDDALDAILDAADDVPYNVQLLAHDCWDDLRDAGTGLSVSMVQTAHSRAAMRLDPVYSQIWLGLTNPQRTAAQVLIVRGDDGLFSEATTKRFGLTTTSMQRAVQGLITKQICWRQSRGGASRLRLEDPLFGQWVRQSIAPPSMPG